jgi:ribosomal protein S8
VQECAELLRQEGYLYGHHTERIQGHIKMTVFLKYDSFGKPVLSELKLFTKPVYRRSFTYKRLMLYLLNNRG